MNRKFLISFWALLVVANANAQVSLSKCQSIFSTVQGAFNKSVSAYQNLRKDVAKLILSDELSDVAALCLDFQEDLYKLTGTAFGNGEASLGPRYLTIPCSNITGSLVTDRTFISVPSGYDKLTVTIEQTDGKSEADIAVCIKDGTGTVVNSKEKNLDGVGKKAEFVFYGTENKYITIHLVKKISVNGFSYKVKIAGEINPEKEDLVSYVNELKNNNTASGGGSGTTPNLPGIIKENQNNGTAGPIGGIKTPTPGGTTAPANTPTTPTQGIVIEPKPMPQSTISPGIGVTGGTPASSTTSNPKPVLPSNPKPTIPIIPGGAAASPIEEVDNSEATNTMGRKDAKQKAKTKNQDRGGTPEGESKETLREKAKQKYTDKSATSVEEDQNDAGRRDAKQKAKAKNQDRGGTPEGESKETLREKAKQKYTDKSATSVEEEEKTKKEKMQEKKEDRQQRKEKNESAGN